MHIIFIIAILITLSSCSNKQNQTGLKFNDVSPRGYSQSVEINNVNLKMLYISGQVPVNSNGELIGLNNLELQTEQVFKNIKNKWKMPEEQ